MEVGGGEGKRERKMKNKQVGIPPLVYAGAWFKITAALSSIAVEAATLF